MIAYRPEPATAVLRVEEDGELTRSVVVYSIQAPDERLRWIWPEQVAVLRRRTGRPVDLVVLCPDAACAAWARTPIRLNSGGVVVPDSLSPEACPAIIDADRYLGDAETALYAAVLRAGDDEAPVIFAAVQRILETLDPRQAEMYSVVLTALLPAWARGRWRAAA